ncbi:DUF1150 family protein [Sedimentitalea arenosa]|jgi:hypothetical protein|uniref:DUF1150 family protein n=1 Tax=Sedimentitalea arenosa TaxID=2798803 RepID=A0A8J7LQJ6_9RHOB|nr:DUF1150 family protein [Arenibacterium arenosum]MBJ6370888.1 DUF1150 family protein [Arenibacterium arenosum]
MDTPFNFSETDKPIVYVKTVDVADLPKEVRAEAGELSHLYAVHSSDGQQLALVADRRMAFVLARQHDFAPVAVH